MKYNDITYSTGEFAAHFGIRKDTLFYYDKINLFSPAGIRENGYRYYTASQIDPFRTLLHFRDLNVPIKTLQEYFQNPSPERLEEMSTRQLEQITKEMEKLKQIQEYLTQITTSLREAAKSVPGKTEIRRIPSAYLLYSQKIEPDLETSEPQWADALDEFILNSDLSGVNNICSVISETDIKNGNFDRIDCLYIESPHKTNIIREGGEYAVYYHKGHYRNVKFAYQDMLSQINDMGYENVGNAYEEYLVSETATKNQEEYITKIMIRIRKKDV